MSHCPITGKPGGIFSGDPKINPDFFDYNMLFWHYCDGASYTGEVVAQDYSPSSRRVSIHYNAAVSMYI